MRTTIEIRDEYRAELLKLAAARGEKGFSGLVNEALELWLRNRQGADDPKKRAAKLRGTLSDNDATSLRESVADIRRRWR